MTIFNSVSYLWTGKSGGVEAGVGGGGGGGGEDEVGGPLRLVVRVQRARAVRVSVPVRAPEVGER
jgi:hypothetical protein